MEKGREAVALEKERFTTEMKQMQAAIHAKEDQVFTYQTQIAGLEKALQEGQSKLESETSLRASADTAVAQQTTEIENLKERLAVSEKKALDAEEDRSMATASLKTKEAFFQGINAEMKTLKVKNCRSGT